MTPLLTESNDPSRMAHQFTVPLSPARTIIANRILAHLASLPEPPVHERTLGGIFRLFDWVVNEADPNTQHEAVFEVEYVLNHLYRNGSISFDDERSFHYVQPDPHAIPPLNN